MFEMLIALIIIVGLVTFSIALAIRWAFRQISYQVERRFRHADTLVNDKCIPSEWLDRYRGEIERLRSKDAPAQDVQRVARKAQAACLRNIDTLISFFERSPFVDNAGTREMLLDELNTERQRWSQAEWETLPG
ncbi:MAG: hypothetical protein CL610_30040 [Anaerolineaceae bacterium]|nr:hypothetical protein [Anaerolineaceae bacterium]